MRTTLARRIAPISRPLFALAVLLLPVAALAHGDNTRLPPEELAKAQVPWLQWDFHPSIFIGIVLFSLLYVYGVTTWRKRHNLAERVETRHLVCFFSAMVLQWWSLDGPLHYLSDERSFFAHMIQHLLLQMIWAPLLISGLPPWLLRPIVANDRVRAIGRWLTRPLNAALIFNGMMLGWHLPPAYDLALRSHPVHIAEHLLFMSSAVIFWWPILSPMKEVPRPTHGVQAAYILLNMIPMKALGLILGTHNTMIYTFYVTQPRVWGLTPLGDQRLGGLVMWIIGGLPLWGALMYVFYGWTRFGTPKRGQTGVAALDAGREPVGPQEVAG